MEKLIPMSSCRKNSEEILFQGPVSGPLRIPKYTPTGIPPCSVWCLRNSGTPSLQPTVSWIHKLWAHMLFSELFQRGETCPRLPPIKGLCFGLERSQRSFLVSKALGRSTKIINKSGVPKQNQMTVMTQWWTNLRLHPFSPRKMTKSTTTSQQWISQRKSVQRTSGGIGKRIAGSNKMWKRSVAITM